MKTDSKKQIISKKAGKNSKNFSSIQEKEIERTSENNVSVFTKTITPKVVIQSENIDNSLFSENINKHQILKICCLIIMSIILLMTFFLTLKTYNAVNELSEYILL